MSTNGTQQSVVRTSSLAAREDQPELPLDEGDTEGAELGELAPPPAPEKAKRGRKKGSTVAKPAQTGPTDQELIAIGRLTINSARAGFAPNAYIQAAQEISEDLRKLKLDHLAELVEAEVAVWSKGIGVLATQG